MAALTALAADHPQGLDISVGLQSSEERVEVRVPEPATIPALREILRDEYGVPGNAQILAQGGEGRLQVLHDSDKPTRAVKLKGVLTLQSPIKFLEEDMLSAAADLNDGYSRQAGLQEIARSQRRAFCKCGGRLEWGPAPGDQPKARRCVGVFCGDVGKGVPIDAGAEAWYCGKCGSSVCATCGVQKATLWRCTAHDRGGLGLRVTPEADGKRVPSRKFLEPDEVFRAAEEFQGGDGILYLRLECSGGWANVTTARGEVMCVRHDGSGDGLPSTHVDAIAQAVDREVLPKHGIEGTEEWQGLAEGFRRFPAFAEVWRQRQVLLGDVSVAEAARMQWEGARKGAPGMSYLVDFQVGELTFREISAGEALVRERETVDKIVGLLHEKIYEGNQEELWANHSMPKQGELARHYLALPGATFLSCHRTWGGKGAMIGGGVFFPFRLHARKRRGHYNINQGMLEDDEDGGRGHCESLEEAAEGTVPLPMCYVNALATTGRYPAGSEMMKYLEHVGKQEGWAALVVHSIRVKATLKFWERSGFRCYDKGMEAPFRLACFDATGQHVAIMQLEEHLPLRPACSLYVKFLQAT